MFDDLILTGKFQSLNFFFVKKMALREKNHFLINTIYYTTFIV
ncbi:hypothetical protein HMPREF3206_00449 [Fusobacterium equinum]|uniref:Uncharacterized protein n=1 Tax=Fusobacterium equinum TaxID=134605 RepID=A0A133NIS2_9FUSO|nr:hypothetical protein HMPREF3206_00449 [Fusobacterium equinum]